MFFFTNIYRFVMEIKLNIYFIIIKNLYNTIKKLKLSLILFVSNI